MPFAKAQRIKPATRSSVFWGVRPRGNASFYKCGALKRSFQCRALKLKNFRIPPSHPPAIVSHSKTPVTRATGGTHLGVFFAPIPTLPPWYFITPKNNHLAINWGTPFGGYWQDKSRILDKCGLFACVASCVLRCGLCRCVIALRAFFLRFVFLRPAVIACVAYCAAYAFRGTSRKGKRGATRGKRPWVFSPRAFRADECGRMHSRSALSEQTSGAPIKIKSIN